MKRIIFLVIACASFGISNAQESKINTSESNIQLSEEKETVTFNKIEHDFGTIPESGGGVSCEFLISNTGDTPVVITKVSASCGCTAPDWSKEPIAPGEQGFVKITFNPRGHNGSFTKSITVFTSGNPQSMRLRIKGNAER